MGELLGGTAFFAVVLTLGAYQVGLWLRKKWPSPLCNPLLIAVILVMAALALLGVPNADYQAGTASLSFLLTPATVCLALPLYEQLQTLKKDLPAILTGVVAGTLASIGGIFLMGRLFGLEGGLLVSLLPKSITTAMGIVLAEQLGGYPAITTAAIVVTGILGSLMGEALSKLLRLRSKVAQGVAFGTASHVIGTSRAGELDPLMGAVSSLSLVVAGVVTAVVLPLVAALI